MPAPLPPVSASVGWGLEKPLPMPRIDETAYRQLKTEPTEQELRELYTPTLDERHLARQHTTSKPALVAFLVLFKTFQHLDTLSRSPRCRCRLCHISRSNWSARSPGKS